MGQTRLDGSLQAGPPNASEGTFPASQTTIPLVLTPNPKPWQVAEPTLTRRVNSPSPSWKTLSGIGANDTVTEAHFIYLRTDSQLSVRITQEVNGDPVTATLNVRGLLILEVSDSEPITLVEVQGTATLDFYAQGQR
jgi:hypothetical protein